jgi:deoxyribose-phosphate aldolase
LTLGTGGFVDYDYYDFADTEIVVGWNFLVIDVDNSTGVGGGGATLTNVDRLKITVRTTGDYTGTQLRMDEWWYATESEFEITPTGGVATFDTINRIATITYDVTAVQYNSFDLGEAKVDNTDSTPVQCLRISNTIFTKSSSYEVVYIFRVQGNPS